jgi:Tfp pilus assembly protein PilP
MRLRLFLPVLITVLAGGIAAAQTPAPAGAHATTSKAPSADAPPVLPPLEPQGYTYDPGGRRDPFVSLLRRGADSQRDVGGARPSGLAGIATSELAVKGIVTSGSGYLAVAQGVDNKTYILHVGDKLFDGEIRAIDADSVVILQQVSDPLSTQKAREVRKMLRQTGETK